MSIRDILDAQGTDYDVKRDGKTVGTHRGTKNAIRRLIGFAPDTDIRTGDSLTVEGSPERFNVRDVIDEKYGDQGARYAKY